MDLIPCELGYYCLFSIVFGPLIGAGKQFCLYNTQLDFNVDLYGSFSGFLIFGGTLEFKFKLDLDIWIFNRWSLRFVFAQDQIQIHSRLCRKTANTCHKYFLVNIHALIDGALD